MFFKNLIIFLKDLKSSGSVSHSLVLWVGCYPNYPGSCNKIQNVGHQLNYRVRYIIKIYLEGGGTFDVCGDIKNWTYTLPDSFLDEIIYIHNSGNKTKNVL